MYSLNLYSFICQWAFSLLPLPESMPLTPLSISQHPFNIGDSWLRLENMKLWCRQYMQFLLCPAFHTLSASFSFYPPYIWFCPVDFPTMQSFFYTCGTSLHLQLPTRVASPLFVILVFFSFFISFFLVVRRFFLIFLSVWRLLQILSRCSMRMVPFVEVFLMHLWGAMNPTSSYSTVLTPLLIFNFLNHFEFYPYCWMGLPWWLSGKESTSSAGDEGSIPGLGIFPMNKKMTMHSSILAWEISWTEGAWWAMVCGVAKSQTGLSD